MQVECHRGREDNTRIRARHPIRITIPSIILRRVCLEVAEVECFTLEVAVVDLQ